ncbi:hypothetical protein [Kitasatospora sp. NPDC005856]|uniref:hypothetical protein n=1 Tax=Kitasatospora sp. NPDC005856 TaxID=3154566 RepID=UPI0033C92032
MSSCQWGWAVAAVVAAVLATGLGTVLAGPFAGLFVITAIAAFFPLAARESPRSFARACLVVGTGLLAWAVIGTIVGMFLFIPAGLLLIVATFADRDNRPGARFALTVPLVAAVVAAAVVTLFVRGTQDPDNEPPPTFHATLDPGGRYDDRDFELRKTRLRDYGATSAAVGVWPVGRLELVVGMPRVFAQGQSRDALKEQILRVPGVVEVRLCTFHTCD